MTSIDNDKRYFLADGSRPAGPFTVEELRAPRSDQPRSLDARTLVWTRGMTDWAQAGEVPELAILLAANAPAQPPPGLTSAPTSPMTGMSSYDEDDYILLNPRLPKFARLLCLYGVVVNPFLWLLSNCSTLTFYEVDESDQGAPILIVILLSALASAVTLLLMLVGGLKLKALRRTGLRLFTLGLWINILVGVAGIVLLVLIVFLLEGPPRKPLGAGDAIEGLLVCVGLMTFGFEIAALVWVYRHRHRLPLI